MNPVMHQLALVKRELWEHKSIYVTPAAVALVSVLIILTGYVFAKGYEGAVEIGIVAGQNVLGEAERRVALMTFLMGNTAIYYFAAGILTIFYCLDALYAERKNKSILFWRSLPITDAETVISKLLTALIAVPIVTWLVVIVAHLATLLLTSLFVEIEGGSAFFMIWKSAPLFDVWAANLVMMLALPIWFSPLIGWFLFVSAWTKRSPLLVGFLPLVVVPLLEYFILRTHFIADAIESRFNQMPLISGDKIVQIFDDDDISNMGESFSLFDIISVGQFLSSPAMWAGVVVCGLFITAAIYVRRYRDDS